MNAKILMLCLIPNIVFSQTNEEILITAAKNTMQPQKLFPHGQVRRSTMKLDTNSQTIVDFFNTKITAGLMKSDFLKDPDLIYVVDTFIQKEELEYAFNVKIKSMSDLQRLFDYDEKRYSTKRMYWDKTPYTVQNIAKEGGICTDKAWFISRILKAHGIPCVMMLKNDYSHQCVAAKLDGKWQFINKRGTGYSFRHPVSGKWLDEDSLMTSVKERKEKTAKISPRYQGWVDLGDRFFEVIDRNDWLASEAEYKRLVSIYQKDPFFWWLCGAHFLMDCLDAGQYDMFLRNAQEAIKICNHPYVQKDIKYLISEAKQDRRLSEDASKKSSFGIK